MSYHTADKEEAQRLWTTSISENVQLSEYKDSGYVITNSGEELWDTIVLEPEQVRELLQFKDTADNSLGEGSLTGELTAHFEDGVYTLEPEDLEIRPVLSREEFDEIVRVFLEIHRSQLHYKKAKEMEAKMEEKMDQA